MASRPAPRGALVEQGVHTSSRRQESLRPGEGTQRSALLLLKPEYGLSADQVALVGSISLIATFFGAVLFGRLGDVLDRKRAYGLEAAIMAIGAVATACSPNLVWLLVARLILGLGIDRDYPIITEYANRSSRGKQVAAFAVALTVLAAGINHDVAWRLMLGLGALPALAVLYNRRRMPSHPGSPPPWLVISARPSRT